MKKLILAAVMVALTGSVFAQQVNVARSELGSAMNSNGQETAKVWDVRDGIFHAPQYMPGYPTAATLWPRVVEVKCKKTVNVKTNTSALNCDGYDWLPEYGRGEYLMIRPVVANEPLVVTNTIIREVPVIILKEVPVKPKKE